MTTGQLIAFRADRLGGRLISLINTLRLAETFDLPAVVHWRDSDDLDDPCDIFDGAFVSGRFIDKDRFKAMRDNAAPIASLMAAPSADAFRAELASGRHAIVDPPFDILTLPFEDADTVKADFIRIARDLPLNPALAAKLAQARADFRSEKRSVAYHIRRGDLTGDRRAMNKAWPNKFVPDEFFEAHMRANSTAGARVILFSDNPGVLKRYRAMFPDLLTFDDIADADGLNAPQRDALELFTMAMADQLIAPPSSAFSSTAKTIGGAAFDDVESQLSPEDRTAALDLLTQRLRDTPEVFANAGEIGQYLVYARDHLVAQGRGGDFATLAAGHIRKGLNIAFVHSMTAREMFLDGQYDALCDLRTVIDRGFVVHSRSYAHLAFFHCLSLLMLGRRDQALAQVSTAFWLEPTEGEINALVGILESQGDLGRSNFWFGDPVVERLFTNRFLLDFVKRFFAPLVQSGALTITRAVPNSRLKIWEWPQFAKSDVGQAFRYKGHFRSTLTALGRHDWTGDMAPHLDSFMGLLALREGDHPRAKGLLLPAVQARPDNALFHKRVAEYHWGTGDVTAATRALDQARALEPDTALFAALMGLILIDAGDPTAAAAAFDPLVAGNTVQIPGVFFAAAAAYERARRPDDAAAAYCRGLRLAPMDWKRQLALADLEHGLGQTDAAIDRLRWTAQWSDERPPVIKTLADRLVGTGQPDAAAEVLFAARTRYPKKAQFAKLHDKLIARQARGPRKARKG